MQRYLVDTEWDGEAANADSARPLDTDPDRIFDLVYRQMYSIVGGRRAELDDLVQIALEQVLKGLPRFEHRSRLSTWTYRVCYLTFLKHERWYKRWLRRFVFAADSLPDVPSEAPGPEEGLERRQRAQRLLLALQRLSPKRRAIVAMHDLEEIEIAEIAEITGVPVLTVRSRLRDGRNDLRRHLLEDPAFQHEKGERRGG
jgi:RNA polymerase sigma-70 factor (ECF subfamily)